MFLSFKARKMFNEFKREFNIGKVQYTYSTLHGYHTRITSKSHLGYLETYLDPTTFNERFSVDIDPKSEINNISKSQALKLSKKIHYFIMDEYKKGNNQCNSQ